MSGYVFVPSMSAIFGIISLNGHSVLANFTRMSRALGAHGPEAEWSWKSDAIAVGQVSMRFTPGDCTEAPSDPSGNIVVVFDGRIDNRQELAESIGIPDSPGRNMCDAAYILRAYERWGEGCASHLVGMYAFALVDAREEKVLLARSPMGERSLFFHQTPACFAFASAPKGIFAVPSVPRHVDLQSAADFLALVPHEQGHSFFAGISQLEPGHVLVLRKTKMEKRAGGSLKLKAPLRLRSDRDYVDAFNEVFQRVIADNLRSITPVALSMSGGLDSTSIAAVAAEILATRGQRLQAFTEVPPSGFKGTVPKGRYADETPFVRSMTRMYANLDVQYVQSNERLYLNDLDGFFVAGEAPLRNPSNWPWMEVIFRQAAERNARVVMTGVPGNLTISWAGENLFQNLIRKGEWKHAFTEAQALARGYTAQSAWRIFAGRGILPLIPNLAWQMVQRIRSGRGGIVSRPPWHDFSPLRADFALSQRVEERARSRGHDFRFRSSASDRLRFIVGQADARANARRAKEVIFGVQQSDPAADMRIVEFCLRIPEDQFLRNGEARWLLRRAMSNRLPAEILNNRLRGLQASNWLKTMRGAKNKIEAAMNRIERSPVAREAIDLPRMRMLLQNIESVRAETDRALMDYRSVLELGLSMGCFLAWIEGVN
jgi:asparagine synthase (glutamine-hydrolysing)